MNGVRTHNFTLVVIGTDYTYGCKSNHHTITAATAPEVTHLACYLLYGHVYFMVFQSQTGIFRLVLVVVPISNP